jgi:putative PIN family toxin of toxin-antitoxin system
VRAVLDPNVLVSALLSPRGAPALLIARWLAGDFELVVSTRLLNELRRALSYPKLRQRIPPTDADAYLETLRQSAVVASDPRRPPGRSADPGDDYLLALAEAERAMLVSGDRHLLDLADRFPVSSPRDFLDSL